LKPPAQVYLVDVINFLDWLLENEPHLEVGAALQGLAGLQLQEATRLTWDKVNLDQGLIEISGQVKNEYRNRVIPVPTRCLEVLKRIDAARRAEMVQDLQGAVVTNRSGFGYGQNWLNYSKEMSAAIKNWNHQVSWKPKDLRNCLPTFAVAQGIHSSIWEHYIGHAPKTVTERHYIPRFASVSIGGDEALEKQMELFSKAVTDPIDAAIEESTVM
jgi:integrase